MGIREGLLEMGDMALSNENVLMGNMRLKLKICKRTWVQCCRVSLQVGGAAAAGKQSAAQLGGPPASRPPSAAPATSNTREGRGDPPEEVSSTSKCET